MLPFFLHVFKSRLRPPSFFFNFGVLVISLVAKIRSLELEIDFNRFKSSQWILPRHDIRRKVQAKSQNLVIDLVFVVAKKDFEVLKFSLPNAFRSIPTNMRGNINLIVPRQDLSSCTILFKDEKLPIRIIDEEIMIQESDRQALKNKFGSRYTWVLQQLLKVAAVLHSESGATLIVDADTIPLRRRNWFNKYGQQILMPSDEYNSDYYLFLSQFGICKNPPEYTFVSHHMLIQRQYLVEALASLKISTTGELINLICNRIQINSQSPVCVDYELYAQFMLNRHPEEIALCRWSNISIPVKRLNHICKSSLRLRVLSLFYNSVSFHSWS